MNASAVARHYANLTAEERFRLMLAAGARGDGIELDRLMKAGSRLTVSFRDHLPYTIALEQVSHLAFIDLLDDAAFYLDVFSLAEDMRDLYAGAAAGECEAGGAGQGSAAEETDTKSAQQDADESRAYRRTTELALAFGFILKTKVDGWKLFCEHMTIPPFLPWGGLAGFSRLQDALALTEKTAFGPEGFLRWLNRNRRAGEPEAPAVPLTIKGWAGALEKLFRERVAWWGG